jgi:hypothetical protein
VSDRFPAGTTVNAYPLSQFPAGQLPWSGALPSGASSAGSATVAADGSLTITGLPANTEYYAYASTPDRYVLFATRSGTSASPGVDQGGIDDSLVASATVTTPAANQVIAQIVAPPPGVYKVTVELTLTGTAETQAANARLRQNATAVATLPTVSGAAVTPPVVLARLTVTAGNIDVQAIALATTGAIYTAVITATRVA